MRLPYLDLAKSNGNCSSEREAFYYRVRDEIQEEAYRRQVNECQGKGSYR